MNAKMPKIERKEEKGHLTRGGCREEKVEEKNDWLKMVSIF